jgi:hypothetical protein
MRCDLYKMIKLSNPDMDEEEVVRLFRISLSLVHGWEIK